MLKRTTSSMDVSICTGDHIADAGGLHNMNLDQDDRLYLIDGHMQLQRDLQHRCVYRLYSQDETLCLIGLIRQGHSPQETYTIFDERYPGRTWKQVKAKIRTLKDARWNK